MTPQRKSAIAAPLGVAILAAVVYLPGLPGDFVYDDHRLIVNNDGFKRPFDPARAFLRDYYASDLDRGGLGYYRPLTVLSKELDYRRGGGGSRPFHVTNIAVHVAATLLVLTLAWMSLGIGVAAACGAVLFAVHAAHAESVAFISGRVDPLATLFVLAMLLLHLRANRVPSRLARSAAGVCWLAALMSKEMAVTAPVLASLLEIAEEGWPKRNELWRRAARYLPYVAVLVVYLPLRIIALGKLVAPSGDAPSLHLVKPLLVMGSYLAWLLLPPWGLHLEPKPVSGALAAAACAVAVAAIIGVVVLWRIGWCRESALVAAVMVALLPVAQIKPLETFLSERFLYLPSAIVAVLAASLVQRAFQRHRSAGIAATCAILGLAVAHVTILEPRVIAWRDEIALWKAKEAGDDGSLKARLNLAHAYARRGEREEALRWFAKVKEIAPELTIGIDAEIGSLAGDLGSDETEAALRRALEGMPEDGSLWSNLGFHLFQKGDAKNAVAAFERSIQVTPNRAAAWLGLALSHLRLREIAEAEQAAGRAIALDPELGLARAVLAECALRDGRPCDALRLASGLVLEVPSEQAMLDTVVARARQDCGESGAPAGKER